MIMPARGRGVIAGSAARHVIELAGVRDVNAKLVSPTKNQLNIARATLKALSFFSTTIIPEKIK
jgi:small subunit ribosomal protein S5